MADKNRMISVETMLVGIETFKRCYEESEKELGSVVVKAACGALGMVERFVKETPTVPAVEVVHGRWIKGKYPGEYTCSRCGMQYCEADHTAKPYKYCPECGSKNE